MTLLPLSPPPQFGCILFLFLVSLLWLGFPILCYIEVATVSILDLFLNLDKNFQRFTIKYNVSCKFVINDLYYVDICFLHIHFVERFFFIINGCWVLLNYFSASSETVTFIFSLVNTVYHIDWIANIEPFLHPQDKSQLIMVYDPYNMLFNSVH